MENNRNSVHLDKDTFFVSVELLYDSGLYGKPMLIGGSGNGGVVAACSYEVRSFGVHTAKPMYTALQPCGLMHGHYQINLFEDTERGITLYQALDRINGKYGSKTVCGAVGPSCPEGTLSPSTEYSSASKA